MNETIYSTVPEEVYVDVDQEQREKVLQFLKQNPGKFYTARQIAKECNMPTRGTQVEVRKAITHLIEEDMQPIIGNVKGFSYAYQSNQMRFYANSLEERMQGLQRRINKVREIAANMENEGR